MLTGRRQNKSMYCAMIIHELYLLGVKETNINLKSCPRNINDELHKPGYEVLYMGLPFASHFPSSDLLAARTSRAAMRPPAK
jgi:hypothetical protein